MNAELMVRAWWFGWWLANDRRLEGEVLRSHAAMLRERCAQDREDASLTRWHAERQREYGKFLLDESATLRTAARVLAAPWLVPGREDPPAELGTHPDRHAPPVGGGGGRDEAGDGAPPS